MVDDADGESGVFSKFERTVPKEELETKYRSFFRVIASMSIVLFPIGLGFLISANGTIVETFSGYFILAFFFVSIVLGFYFSDSEPSDIFYVNRLFQDRKFKLKVRGRWLVVNFLFYITGLTMLVMLDGGVISSSLSNIMVLTITFGTYLAIKFRTKITIFLVTIGCYILSSMVYIKRDNSKVEVVYGLEFGRVQVLHLSIVIFVVFVSFWLTSKEEEAKHIKKPND